MNVLLEHSIWLDSVTLKTLTNVLIALAPSCVCVSLVSQERPVK